MKRRGFIESLAGFLGILNVTPAWCAVAVPHPGGGKELRTEETDGDSLVVRIRKIGIVNGEIKIPEGYRAYFLEVRAVSGETFFDIRTHEYFETREPSEFRHFWRRKKCEGKLIDGGYSRLRANSLQGDELYYNMCGDGVAEIQVQMTRGEVPWVP